MSSSSFVYRPRRNGTPGPPSRARFLIEPAVRACTDADRVPTKPRTVELRPIRADYFPPIAGRTVERDGPLYSCQGTRILGRIQPNYTRVSGPILSTGSTLVGLYVRRESPQC